MKSSIKCTTPRCVEAIEKYGEHYHGVHDVGSWFPGSERMPDAVAKCERCGGVTNGEKWLHACAMCGKEVEPGKLVGFFVPSRCSECDAKVVAEQRADGRVCGRCGQVIAYCCC